MDDTLDEQFKAAKNLGDDILPTLQRIADQAGVRSFISNNPNLIGKVLDEGVEGADSLADILLRQSTNVDDFASLLRASDVTPSEVQTLLRSIDDASVSADDIATVTQLNNLRKQPDDAIDLLGQELNGGHSIAQGNRV